MSEGLTFQLVADTARSPEEVWRLVATPEGLASWLGPATVEGRAGGTIAVELPGAGPSVATIATWEPPRKLVHDEQDWVAGFPASAPLRTQLTLLPKQHGGCVLRLEVATFCRGEHWERQSMADRERLWQPLFDVLRG